MEAIHRYTYPSILYNFVNTCIRCMCGNWLSFPHMPQVSVLSDFYVGLTQVISVEKMPLRNRPVVLFQDRCGRVQLALGGATIGLVVLDALRIQAEAWRDGSSIEG